MSNQDRRHFLSLLRTYKERAALKVYAYCLMPQEAHLLIQTERPNLSAVMQGFNTVYTKWFNSEHNTSGHVFQGRYKALLVDRDRYLAEMTRYIHLAPARAGLKERPWRYQWSSCAAYVEADGREPLVDSEPVLRTFGSKLRIKQSVRYLQYIKDRMRSASDVLLPISRGIAIGSEAFLAKTLEEASEPDPVGAAQRDMARRLLTETAAKHGIDEEKLVGPLQWRELTAVRRKAMYRIWRETRLGVTELGRLFNRTPSAVSQVIKAMEFAGSR